MREFIQAMDPEDRTVVGAIAVLGTALLVGGIVGFAWTEIVRFWGFLCGI